MASLSLRKRFSRSISPAFLIVGFLLCAVVWVMDYFTQRYYSQEVLQQRAESVHVSFAAYLDRANFEVKYLSEQISDGETIDRLFQLHDVLFFGGLDFFYVALEDGTSMEDPRVRLYTRDALSGLIKNAESDVWLHVSTTDQSELLVYKKSLASDEDKLSKGFFYGFISLDNNLALASDLIGSAGADYLKINDVVGKPLLIEQLSSFSDETPFVHHESTLSLPVLKDKLAVEVRYSRPLFESFSSWAVIGSLAILAGLLLLNWAVRWYAQRTLFMPIAGLPAIGRMDTLNYQEFEPLLAQMNYFQTRLKARDQHLDLLLNSLQAAILFCDESARVTDINDEAALLFPESPTAKTIFDMTPIACHQPIQRALKGEYGGGFELELKDQPKVYAFQTHTFVNEHGFRSVMLVGRDVSEVRRLRWHLTHRFPRQAIDRPQPSPHLIFDEISERSEVVLKDPEEAIAWFGALGQLLKQASEPAQEAVQVQTLGALLCEQQAWLERELGVCLKRCDCTVEAALEDTLVQANWTSDHAALIRLAFMLCLGSSLSGRHLVFSWDKKGLVIKVYGAEESSAVLGWLCQEYPKVLKGRTESAKGGFIKMTATVKRELGSAAEELPAKGRVAFIENDYVDVNRVKQLLNELAIKWDGYASFAEFMSASQPYHCQYDVLMIGLGDETLAQTHVQKLLHTSGSDQLPILYLADHAVEQMEGQILYAHQLMAYSLAKVMESLRHFSAINMGDWATQDTNFIITGGSSMSQVIWQSELSAHGFVVRREVEIDNLVSVLRHTSPVNIIVLDHETAMRAQKLHLVKLVNTRWVVLEDFSERPDTMHFMDLDGRVPDDAVIASLLRIFNI